MMPEAAKPLPVDELDEELAKDRIEEDEVSDERPQRTWSLWKKIHWIQGKLKAIPKDATLDVGGGRQVPVLSHNAMVARIRPMFDDVGLVLLSTVTDYEMEIQIVQKANGQTKSAYFHKLKKHYTLVNVDGPEERFEFDGYGTSMSFSDKGYGAAESYCKKYALRSLFLIETEDDPDLLENLKIQEPQSRQRRPKGEDGQEKMYGKPVAISLQKSDHPAGQNILYEAWVAVSERWSDGKKITVPQIKRLYTIAGKNGWNDQAVATVTKHKLGIESMKDVPMDAYDALCSIFESFDPTTGEPGEDDGPIL
jgi:hypothetical protein